MPERMHRLHPRDCLHVGLASLSVVMTDNGATYSKFLIRVEDDSRNYHFFQIRDMLVNHPDVRHPTIQLQLLIRIAITATTVSFLTSL